METLTHHIWIGFAGGLLSFAHCLGMCGGFILHLSQGQSRSRALANQLFWLAGKLFCYLFLGAVAGFAGGYVGRLLLKVGLFQNLLSYLAGAALFFAGLSLLGLLPNSGTGKRLIDGIIADLDLKSLMAPSPGVALTLGVVTGFLPCPTVVGFIAYALSSGSVSTGMATMGSLGLGTVLPLLLFGGVSCLSRLHLRSWAPKAGGLILIVLGLTTALRGTSFYHNLLGCPANPVLQATATDASAKPCCTLESHGTSGN